MVHVLLIILQVIGWILLSIIGLVVLLLCIVLFVPICYRLNASCQETPKNIEGKAYISWLFRILSVHLEFREQQLIWRLRILHKKFGTGIEKVEKKPKKVKEPRKAKKVEEKPRKVKEPRKAKKIKQDTSSSNQKSTDQDLSLVFDEDQVVLPDKSVLEEKPVEDSSLQEDKDIKVRKLTENQSKDNHYKKSTDPQSKDNHYKKSTDSQSKYKQQYSSTSQEEKPSFFERIECTYHKVCDKLSSLWKKFMDLIDKKDKIVSFLTHPMHEKAIRKVLKALVRIIKSLKPKRIRGRLLFGFENPAMTGYLLAGTSILQPTLGKHAIFEANFDQEVLDGEIYIKSRIYIATFVFPVLWLLLSKAVRITIRDVRNFKL